MFPSHSLSGFDPVFADDFLIKEGSMGEYESRLLTERPSEWFDWIEGEPGTNLTFECEGWRAYYKRNFPLCFYHEKKFVLGIDKEPSLVRIDYASRDQGWARLSGDKTTLEVIIERDDYPRFRTEGDVDFSHTPLATELPNVFRLGNGYSIACTRKITPREFGAFIEGECWWMVGPTEDEEDLSRRVLAIKVYDGPHFYEARGTDVSLVDPAPLTAPAEYVIYAYDEKGIRGSHREIFEGVKPEKRALVLSGESLLSYDTKRGLIREKNKQLAGNGKVYYELPLNATKLLDVYARGSEVDIKIRADSGEYTGFEDYDGKAVNTLGIEASIFNSLSSIRVEWESLRDWIPVGRPVIDVLPVRDQANETERNKIRITGEEGEGLGQIIDLFTGSYTVTADVRCLEGEALIGVGGYEIVNWQRLDKTITASGEFAVNTDDYELVLTGTNSFSFEIDKIRLMEGTGTNWLEQDIRFFIQTEDREVEASDSINRSDVPVSLGETKRWRVGIDAPPELNNPIKISALYIDVHKTGEDHITKHLRWKGEGRTRVYYPENVVRRPVSGDWIQAISSGSVAYQQSGKISRGDLKLQVDGGKVFYKNLYIYRPVIVMNEFWRVEIGEEEARILHQGNEVGTMLGQGLPFKISHINTEDIQLDCAVGFVQLRRGMGPRFHGWEIFKVTERVAQKGAVTAWGFDREEAIDNLPYYSITVSR